MLLKIWALRKPNGSKRVLLGTLAAAEWFNQYEAKNGCVPNVKMVFDRGLGRCFA